MNLSFKSVMRLIGMTMIVPVVISHISCSYSKPEILSNVIDPNTQSIAFFWKNEKGEPLKSLANLKQFVESQKLTLTFAMNGGMYDKKNRPIGLYMENGLELNKLNTRQVKPNQNGVVPNFYIQPNGVFYITQNKQAGICKTSDFGMVQDVKYATQSGPLLVIDSAINSAFRKGSDNREIRNGVGILPNNQVVFAMSKGRISFYDFADHFRSLGCRHALFLDGVVSQTYLPDQNWRETGGDFGVMIGIVK